MMTRLANEEDDEMMKAVFNLCHLKHALVDSVKDTLFVKEQGNVARGFRARNQQLQHDAKRKTLQITRQEIVYVAQGLANYSNIPHQGLFYGGYAPPRLPPVPSLQRFIGICSEPFEKQLTYTDVKYDQSRLAMGKEDVQKRLIPLLNENEDLSRGILVTTYNLEGKPYPMVFKIWVGKTPVLTAGWTAFCQAHKLVEKQDFLTIWMFRNTATGHLCFVIDSRRLPVLEIIKKRRRTRS